MSFRPALLSCAAAGLLLSACGENTFGPTSTTIPAEPKNRLVAATWSPAARTVLPGLNIDGEGTIVTDLIAHEDPCVHDDVTRFTADGKWVGDEGPAKCEGGDPQTISGTWSFNTAGDSITITNDSKPGADMIARIVDLSDTRMILSVSSDNWPDGATREETFTWKAK